MLYVGLNWKFIMGLNTNCLHKLTNWDVYIIFKCYFGINYLFFRSSDVLCKLQPHNHSAKLVSNRILKFYIVKFYTQVVLFYLFNVCCCVFREWGVRGDPQPQSLATFSLWWRLAARAVLPRPPPVPLLSTRSSSPLTSPHRSVSPISTIQHTLQ